MTARAENKRVEEPKVGAWNEMTPSEVRRRADARANEIRANARRAEIVKRSADMYRETFQKLVVKLSDNLEARLVQMMAQTPRCEWAANRVLEITQQGRRRSRCMIIHKTLNPVPVYTPPSDSTQYLRLVTLAFLDLSNRGFTETAIEQFLERRCAVPFSTVLEVPSPALAEAPFASMWQDVLTYARSNEDSSEKN
jgi:hypothetical protein